MLVLDPETPYVACMATGEPVVFDRLDSAAIGRINAVPGGSDPLAGYSSFVAVPLAARGTILGFAVFARTSRSPGFGAHDVTLALGMAAQAAICIDNARLYGQERRTALALQRSLLPGHLAVPAGLEMAHRYLPNDITLVLTRVQDPIAEARSGRSSSPDRS